MCWVVARANGLSSKDGHITDRLFDEGMNEPVRSGDALACASTLTEDQDSF